MQITSQTPSDYPKSLARVLLRRPAKDKQLRPAWKANAAPAYFLLYVGELSATPKINIKKAKALLESGGVSSQAPAGIGVYIAQTAKEEGRLVGNKLLSIRGCLRRNSHMVSFLRRSFHSAILFCLAAMTTSVFAQEAATTSVDDRLAKLEIATSGAQSAGDNAWMLVCAALVLLMTGPGLALFYGGLVRRKNVLATMMQSFILMAVVTVIWALYGYSLAFAEGSSFIGGLDYLFLNGVGAAPNADYAATIPQQTFMIYQLMFAIITPALITGAFAERMKFSAMLAFMVLWVTFVYFPLAHMVWGKGGFLNAVLGGTVPALDFAGGTVVHISSGVSALVCALYLGKRVGYPKAAMPPHSLVLSFIGACMLWVGWFGFNAGSALSAGSLASSAFVVTHFAAATGTLGWVVAEWLRSGKPTVLGAISGAVAGLVVITPASGFVTPMSGLLIGFLGGAACFVMVTEIKKRFGYDDSLDVFGVHGTAGTLGAALTGVFATSAVNPIFKNAAGEVLPVGLIDGNGAQIVNQLIGIGISIAIAVIGSLIILKLVDMVIGVRVSADEEMEGLDLSQHGEDGYNFGGDRMTGSASAFNEAFTAIDREPAKGVVGAKG